MYHSTQVGLSLQIFCCVVDFIQLEVGNISSLGLGPCFNVLFELVQDLPLTMHTSVPDWITCHTSFIQSIAQHIKRIYPAKAAGDTHSKDLL